ncbi:MAG: hypothetical protein EKK48_23635 [Candidatus Melainabacteria bacterium]|nr:MAG: hypothetical protein EKK48_23635 [Candidatus Melainabacteria bacterium]
MSSKRTRTKSMPVVADHGSVVPTREHALKTMLTDQEAEKRLRALTDNYRFKSYFEPPADMQASLKAMRKDLSEVPVLGKDGKVTDVFAKFEADKLMSARDKELIWKCLALVREAFLRMENIDPSVGKPPVRGGYQWNMNWKHIRAEIDQVLEAAKLLNLNASETRDAIIASIFSDAIKTKSNFIIHNIHGAYGAAQALSYILDVRDPDNLAAIEEIARAVREHQIAPPEFMARVVTILIQKKLQGRGEAKTDTVCDIGQGGAIEQIYSKIADPFNRSYLNVELTKIAFNEEERRLLKLIEIDEWYVPHPDNPQSKIAHAVIAGDHSINYNHPEGFAKIALIRGPDTEAIFEDPTVLHSLDSAVNSFADSFRVIRPEVHSLALSGLRRTKTAVERVTRIMRELFSGIIIGPKEEPTTGIQKVLQAIEKAHDKDPELFTVEHKRISGAGREYHDKVVEHIGDLLQDWFDTQGSIPFNPKDKVEPGALKLPYWNTPLKYPERDEHGRVDLSSLNELQRKQFAFAERIREIAVELLRAEQWIF